MLSSASLLEDQCLAMFTLHFIFVLPFVVEMIASSDTVGNTNRLLEFYRKIADYVQNEGSDFLRKELSKEFIGEKENQLKHKLIDDINTLSTMHFTSSDVCNVWEGFKLARGILESYNELKHAFTKHNSVLDSDYQTLVTYCPKLANGVRKDTTTISLLLTEANGYGQFMGRSDSPDSYCCKFENETSGEERYQLQFRFQNDGHKTVRFGDVVGIWTQGRYLKNTGKQLSWVEWEWDDRMRWTIEPFCHSQAVGQEIYQCDLVTFLTNWSFENGYYLQKLWTVRWQWGCIFAILAADEQYRFPD